VTKRTPRSGSTAKRATTSRTTTRTTASRTTRRRTSSGTSGYRTRRRTPRTATTLGSAFALGLIAVFTGASWPIRIGAVVVVLIVAAGYLLVRARQGGQGAAPDPAVQLDPPAPTDAKDAEP